MEDFRHKAWLVARGHMNNAPATIMFAGVVSRETIRIALMITALNDLELKSADILNAYAQAPVTEKCGLLWVQSLVKIKERLQ